MIPVWVVLVSMVLSVVLGFIWYGPLFGKPWMKLSGIPMPEGKPSMKMMVKPILLSLIGALLLTYVLSFIIEFHNSFYHTNGYMTSLSMVFVAWLGLIVPPYLNFAGWERRPWKLFAINTGYWLVYFMLAGALIASVL